MYVSVQKRCGSDEYGEQQEHRKRPAPAFVSRPIAYPLYDQGMRHPDIRPQQDSTPMDNEISDLLGDIQVSNFIESIVLLS